MNSQKSLLLLLLCFVFSAYFLGCKSECKDVSCANGACLEGNCLCNTGWTGPNCDQPDKCYQRNCGNGYCSDGLCLCDPLYEGNSCSEPINQKFAGNFAANDVCTNGPLGYSVIIAISPGTLDELRISNLYNFGGYVNAQISGDKTSFSIERQQVGFGNELESTSATIDADHRTIHVNYTVFQGSNIYDQCVLVLTRY